MEQQNNKLHLAVSPETQMGKYANLAIIAHTQTEFIFDFASVMPAQKTANVVSRVILAPEHAKRVLLALQDNIRKYETNFGTIRIHDDNNPANSIPMSLGGGEA